MQVFRIFLAVMVVIVMVTFAISIEGDENSLTDPSLSTAMCPP